MKKDADSCLSTLGSLMDREFHSENMKRWNGSRHEARRNLTLLPYEFVG